MEDSKPTSREPKHVELYQLVIAVILVMGSIAKTYVDMNSRISILETKRVTDDVQTEKLYTTLDKLLEQQTIILIKLESKQNKTN